MKRLALYVSRSGVKQSYSCYNNSKVNWLNVTDLKVKSRASLVIVGTFEKRKI